MGPGRQKALMAPPAPVRQVRLLEKVRPLVRVAWRAVWEVPRPSWC